ncbi:MAG: UDP-glucose/GDP-mannose dehydrogenase family protein [Vampirovibrionales bacterium]|nr:UDP-glucose/GDP-mannose dehydrogenase family protein [Vampirovibrionales bacterium]
MKLAVVGTGYVGLVTGTCLAEMGNTVMCVDNNADKVARLKQGEVPIYEPGLEELIKINVAEERLTFTTDLPNAVQAANVCFIAVGTPQDEDGSADLSSVLAVAKAIASAMNSYKVIVVKSTVPVGTCARVKATVQETLDARGADIPFSVVSNPEFLKQGAAVDDFLKPDRVVIGVEDPQATDMMREIYSPFLRTGNPILFMDIKSSEMTKYVANAFLATKISFMNEMANLCETLGADVEMVRSGICSDSRIGSQFMFPGLGYGGSCFPKDVKALMNTAKTSGYASKILDAVDAINQAQRKRFLEKINARFEGKLSGKTFAVWGLAFKPRTDDMREAPAQTIIEALLAAGATVKAYDPKATHSAKSIFGDRITYCDKAMSCTEDADALLLLTEWPEFRRPDFEQIKAQMRTPVLFDGRNQFEPERMKSRGFEYVCIGRAMETKSLVSV